MSGRGRGRGRGRGSGPLSSSQQYLQTSALEAGIDVRQMRCGTGGLFPDLELHSSGERRLLPSEIENLKNGSGITTGADNNNNNGGGGGKSMVKQEQGVAHNKDGSLGTQHLQDPTPPAKERPRSPETIALISKARELHHRFQNSVFYVRSTKEVPDVVRYGDRLRPPPNIDAGAVLMRIRGVGGGAFVPEELCVGQRRISNVAGMENDGNKKGKRGLNLAELAAKIKSEGGMDRDGEDNEGGDEYAAMAQEDEEESDGEDYKTNHYESEGDESNGSDGEPTF
eukprot:CAMPEP_0181140748 /NCGR_PEP_ID=MMETSP1071-20121207/35465_1 /TAXON_ID=35127 /ORGANISM="Thalassiosira sp., Strain NH16" /LENGTH=282 /DNA_ID=CAMNT_0023227711 /DNA_START=109 /DNA_END=957 /DNA_ORIENTATION=+